MPDQTPNWFKPIYAVMLLVAIAWLPVLRGGFVSDDTALIPGRMSSYDNTSGLALLLTSSYWQGTGIPEARLLYRPWVSFTYWVEYALSEDNPVIYHVSNWIVHTANTGLLYAAITPVIGPGPALAVAGLFGTSPAGLYSVGWIAGRTDLWVIFFTLLFIIALRKARQTTEPAYLVGAVLCYLGAILSKESGFIAPVFAWLLFRSEPESSASPPAAVRPWKQYLWLLAPVVIVLAIRQAIQSPTLDDPGEKDFLQYTLPALAEQLWRHAFNVWVPLHSAMHSVLIWSRYGQFTTGMWVAWAGFVLFAALTIIGLFKRQPWATGAIWFAAGLLGIYALGKAWRPITYFYIYFALPGIWLFTVHGLLSLLAQLKVSLNPRALGAAAALVIVGFAVISYSRAPILHDEKSLYSYQAEVSPGSLYAQMDLGQYLIYTGEEQAGVEHLYTAARIDTTNPEPFRKLVDYYIEQGNLKEAAVYADVLYEGGQNDWGCQYTLGKFYYAANSCSLAVAAFRQSLYLRPPSDQVLFDYGLALICAGENAEAADAFRYLTEIHPDHPETFHSLGLAQENLGKLPEAAQAYEMALRINNQMFQTYASLALVYQQMNMAEAATRAAAAFLNTAPPGELRDRIAAQLQQAGVVMPGG